MATPASTSLQRLGGEFKSLQREPVEGFVVTLPNDDDLYLWQVAIFGPPDTPYQGGYFKAELKFPIDYPYSPPKLRFLTAILHPNVYSDGELCISILHPPGEDTMSGELPQERWNPTQSVRTILLSVISLLNEPNTFSAANVDASVLYRRWHESRGKDKQYIELIRKQIELSLKEAEKDGVKVPQTVEEYCAAVQKEAALHMQSTSSGYDVDDMLDYDDYVESSDVDDDDEPDHDDSSDNGMNCDSGTA